MKDNEADYLNNLFASTIDDANNNEADLPLFEVSKDLSSKLHAIADSSPLGQADSQIEKACETVNRRGVVISWPKVSGIAASLLVAIMGLQFYQQQQTLSQLKQAQTDLATALHYLGEANRITQTQVLNSLNSTTNKAGALPVIEIDRADLIPEQNNFERETEARDRAKTLNRTL